MPIDFSVKQILGGLLPLIPKREKRRFGGLLVLLVAMAVLELALAGFLALLATVFGSPETALNRLRLMTGIVDPGSLNDPRILAAGILGCVLLVMLGKNALLVFQQQQMSRFSESVEAAARSRVFRFYQRAPYSWILQNNVAELNFGLFSTSFMARTVLCILHMFSSVLSIVVLCAGMVGFSPLSSLLFMALLSLGGFLVLKVSKRFIDRCAKVTYAEEQAIARVTHMALNGLKEIRLYARENPLFSIFTARLNQVAQARTTQQAAARLPVAGLEILGFFALMATLLLLIFVQNASMSRISGVTGFMAASAWRGLPMANRLVENLTLFRIWKPYMLKVLELLRLEQTMREELLALDERADSPASLPFSARIDLENVGFCYPGAARPALDRVSLSIASGSMLGIVGSSGAGKSTLVDILTGLIRPDTGRLLVDGVPIVKENAALWLRRIGYVAQSPYILDATLAENVALSRFGEQIDREGVLRCCRMASMDFLDELEQGIDTLLGERGARLSGGQAQRVAIARALYGAPDLIIFDEATSSLDLKNEAAIHDTILALRSRVTLVVIAHRLATVEGCDALVWLDKGRVKRLGKASEVLPEYTEVLRRSEPDSAFTG